MNMAEKNVREKIWGMGHINYVSVESVAIRHNEHECRMRIRKKTHQIMIS